MSIELNQTIYVLREIDIYQNNVDIFYTLIFDFILILSKCQKYDFMFIMICKFIQNLDLLFDTTIYDVAN